MDLVSIVMPCYNGEEFIRHSIESVLSQTYACWELIVCDDSSIDNSREIIQEFAKRDSRIRFIVNSHAKGAAGARNSCIDLAEGRYIAFLDADDLWRPEKLERQLQFMVEKRAALSFSAYEVITESGELVRECISVPETITKNQYLGNTIIGCLTVMIDKTKFSQEIVMPNLRSSHDVALWVDLLSEIGVGFGYQKVLASYRLVGTSNTSNKFIAAKEVWLVYRNYLKFGLLKSAFYFVQYAFNALLKRGFRFF